MTKNRESTDDKQETTHNYDTYTHTHTPIQIRSSDDWRTAPNTFIIERYRDTFTPVDCGRATNQVHRPKVKREKIQVPKCIRLIDKTRQAEAGEAGSKPLSQTEIRMISAPNGGCYWLVLPCPLHRWLRVCLVPAELRVSVWCQLGTDARDSLYLALNGRMLRARYMRPTAQTDGGGAAPWLR